MQSQYTNPAISRMHELHRSFDGIEAVTISEQNEDTQHE
jgi:hypothetical protein